MDDAKKLPLDIHLLFSPQGETIEPHDPADVGKGRLGNGYPQTVQGSTRDRIDLALHPLGKRGLTCCQAVMKKSHLTDVGAFRMPQAGRTQLAKTAGRLRSFKFSCEKFTDLHLAAAPV